jgi:DNA polymerase III subunit delta'
MQFNKIQGQQKVKQKLIQTVNNRRISHAQLFLGPEGAGALPLAIAYVQYINCLQPIDDDSCGLCSSCIKFEKLIHPDLHFSFPTIAIDKKKTSNDYMEEWRQALTRNPYLSELEWLLTMDDEGKKQGNITAEECRELIRKLSLKAYEASYKTAIIWLPEYLKTEGNMLLKLFEEPPPQTLIILVAQDADKVLATILSRMQLTRIQPLSDEEIVDSLMQYREISNEEAVIVSRLAGGNLSMALFLADSGRENYHHLFAQWMRACYSGSIERIDAQVATIVGTGKEFIKSFIGYSLHMVRSVFLYNYGNRDLLKLNTEEAKFVNDFSFALKEDNLADITQSLNSTAYHLERNADLKITFLNLSLYIGSRLHKATK